MYPRTEYEMTQEDLDAILSASRSVPAMFASGGAPLFRMPQENANAAWAALGAKMGFDYVTVRSISGKGERFFSAVPSGTQEARNERMARQAKEARGREIDKLTDDIAKLQSRLDNLRKE